MASNVNAMLQWLCSGPEPAWSPSINSILCMEASKALPHLRELVNGNSNFRFFCPWPDAIVYLPVVQSTGSASHTSSSRQPSLGNQPLMLSFSSLSPFLCLITAFPLSCSLLVSPHLHLLWPKVTFLWPQPGMTCSHLLTLPSYGHPWPSTHIHLQKAVLQEHFILPWEHCKNDTQNKIFHRVTQKLASRLCNPCTDWTRLTKELLITSNQETNTSSQGIIISGQKSSAQIELSVSTNVGK